MAIRPIDAALDMVMQARRAVRVIGHDPDCRVYRIFAEDNDCTCDLAEIDSGFARAEQRLRRRRATDGGEGE